MKIENFYSCRKYSALRENNGLSHAAALAECFWNKEVSEQALMEKYKEVSFPFDWVRQKTVRRDVAALSRLMGWLSNMQVAYWGMDYSYVEQGCSYEGKCILCKKPDGKMAAVIPMLQTSDRGLGGKSVHTNVTTLLQPLCAKFFLEDRYPGIQVFVFYLFNSKDEDARLTEVLSMKQKGGNVYTPDYSGFYSDGRFDREGMKTLIDQVLRMPVQPPCFNCDRAGLCKREIPQTVSYALLKEGSVYQMPKFTKEQERVVNHLDGPMRVSAGPGGGKTATLVGRVKRLLDQNVYPEVILVVTFTQKAAGELMERCSSFCETMPTVCTIHSLCYRILCRHADILGKKVSALTDAVKMEIVENLLSIYPQDGFACSREYGKGGLFRTVARRIEEFQGCISKEAFLREHPELGNNFFTLAKQYAAIVEARGLITFDEMVVLTNKMFAEHPEILKLYQSLYRYVMVDEFQDVDKEQAKFLYSIAAHGNLVVVGDDDQGIYGFRGGNGKFMIEFDRTFPEAKTVTLSQNFRSTGAIVNASAKLIENNRSRIRKELKAARGKGMDPVVVSGRDADAVSAVVKRCLKNGYSYGDIAVLSTKNKPLEDLHTELTIPNVLAKAYLRNTRLFLCLLNTLRLLKDPGNEYAQSELSLLGMTHLKDSLLTLCYSVSELSTLVSEVAILTGCEAELPGMLNFIEQSHLYSKSDLLGRMTYMERFEDEARAELPPEDKVLLITAHESKGREFPVVIMLDDYMEETEESRRLYYVAMTRAKDLVYIMRDEACKTDFISEFNHSELKMIG